MQKVKANIRDINFQKFQKIQNQFFFGTFLHYGSVPEETMFGKRIAERRKVRKERLDEIKIKEQNISNELFEYYFSDYQNPSNMYNKYIETEDDEMNQIKVNLIKKILSKLQKTVDYAPKDNTFKIKENKRYC